MSDGPFHQWDNRISEAAAFLSQGIFDTRGRLGEDFTGNDALYSEGSEGVRESPRADPAEVLEQLVETKSGKVTEGHEETQRPFLSEQVDDAIRATLADLLAHPERRHFT